jgi:hypothetical protein
MPLYGGPDKGMVLRFYFCGSDICTDQIRVPPNKLAEKEKDDIVAQL